MTPEASGSGRAYARAALAGNPSDGYGGAVLALTLPGREATATARRDGRAEIDPPSELVAATVRRFAAAAPAAHAPADAPAAPAAHAPAARAPIAGRDSVSWRTTIPRSVGLGGSSAIVVATLRALCAAHEVTIAPIEMARLALAVEVEDLGIAAGWQDRIAQTHDGLTFMDFAADPPTTTRLDPAMLPPLVIAWRAETAGDSGAVHAPLRDRHAEGDPEVRRAIAALADAARRAAGSVGAGDHAALCAGVDASFEARRSMLALDPRHVEMVQTARAAGAAANYAGSGGAIVAVCADPDHRERVEAALVGIGCATLASGQGRPRRSPPPDPTSVT